MLNQQEIWKDVKGYEGIYKISNLGRVFSLVTKGGIILKTNMTMFGYIKAVICKKSRRTVFVHRLVAESFIDNPENKPFVNHINGMKTDNRAVNLEWCTHKENMAHAHRIGLRDVRGEKSGMAKLKNEDVLEIRKLYIQGGYTHKMLAIKFGVYETAISNIINRKTWKHI